MHVDCQQIDRRGNHHRLIAKLLFEVRNFTALGVATHGPKT